MIEPAIKLVECPRDAMQGIQEFIPTQEKVRYINVLLQTGFHTIDFGSFVSPKAMPQMRDTAEVLRSLDLGSTKSKLLAIVANTRGAEEACKFDEITYLGFPLSLSETFQQRNTNKSIAEAMNVVAETQGNCLKHGKTLVVYLSMGFGNPYGDPYEIGYVADFVEKLVSLKVEVISLADTIGASEPGIISTLFNSLIPAFEAVEFGAHLHSTPATAMEKIAAAYNAGCRRFDGAIRGFGGCPMAKDDLVGNIATETILQFAASQGISSGVDMPRFGKACEAADVVFGKYSRL